MEINGVGWEKERGERDSNPRVMETVDFKSTAIPGYAISAVSLRKSRCILLFGFRIFCLSSTT